jgi:hypothetical protein
VGGGGDEERFYFMVQRHLRGFEVNDRGIWRTRFEVRGFILQYEGFELLEDCNSGDGEGWAKPRQRGASRECEAEDEDWAWEEVCGLLGHHVLLLF